jgi:UTP--glucose-1-phosphate uridylyltransferase
MVSKAVIPAAGFGTRFLPATKSSPKEMLPIVDTPVIQHVVEEAVAAGITDIIMVIGKGKRAIEEHFDRNWELEQELEAKKMLTELESIRRISDMADVHFVWQKGMNGLGDAVNCARHHIGREPFAILLGDTVTDGPRPVTAQLLDVFAAHQRPVVALEEVPWDRVSRYGVAGGTMLDGRVMRIEALVEKPTHDEAPSNLVIASRYILTAEIFDHLAETGRGKNNEIQLTDAMKAMLADGPMYGLKFDGERFDVGNKLGFLKTNINFALRDEELRGPIIDYLRTLTQSLDV